MTVTSSSPLPSDQQREGVEKVIKQERNEDPDSTVRDEEKMEADFLTTHSLKKWDFKRASIEF